ncbi:unnamed protein product [Vitrella brassicaformis CCMP3155]|uniref:AAA+ ATPase domain-containing protein n=1 Tax=Vitrella brassicaformis (strain CCMP3155) TaxID=1169540 RepID=A0A0G4EQX1_VITBC|nr:unnamed protein product [Vitrella brassicaformis CCMP3155]|mmetsp:Transcript_26395/g.75663  ORF Transcript_26395/g.75663 Transcript_26395/m.75663 type:complete len:336 (+) Transcript_26395:3-1010(+)|eukprot:CEL99846.1 unnamed protein product [Vitrella brassicaformis CCMP3155]
MTQPWVEKYRPRELIDVVGNEAAVERLRAIARDGSMPNLILAGPPGTGKTTSVLCLANTLLGDAAKTAVLELNASDDRGIDVVRNKIKMFATQKMILPSGRHKIVIMDEADALTENAQQALRRTMELHSSTTRFALACNASTKIIEPIQSRCAVLRFTRLSDKQVTARLKHIIEEEKVDYVDSGLEALVFSAEGDMRNAINNLQSTWSGFSMVNNENVFKVCDQPHPQRIKDAIDACTERDWDTAYKILEGMWRAGYAGIDIIATMFRVLKTHDMNEQTRLEYLKTVGITHMRFADGVSSLVQIGGLLARLCLAAPAKQQGGGPGGPQAAPKARP